MIFKNVCKDWNLFLNYSGSLLWLQSVCFNYPSDVSGTSSPPVVNWTHLQRSKMCKKREGVWMVPGATIRKSRQVFNFLCCTPQHPCSHSSCWQFTSRPTAVIRSVAAESAAHSLWVHSQWTCAKMTWPHQVSQFASERNKPEQVILCLLSSTEDRWGTRYGKQQKKKWYLIPVSAPRIVYSEQASCSDKFWVMIYHHNTEEKQIWVCVDGQWNPISFFWFSEWNATDKICLITNSSKHYFCFNIHLSNCEPIL